jgi:hypothetical protein
MFAREAGDYLSGILTVFHSMSRLSALPVNIRLALKYLRVTRNPSLFRNNVIDKDNSFKLKQNFRLGDTE